MRPGRRLTALQRWIPYADTHGPHAVVSASRPYLPGAAVSKMADWPLIDQDFRSIRRPETRFFLTKSQRALESSKVARKFLAQSRS